ncbi:MAG TPA: FAD-binding oxidoreductase [Acidimicrobiales bacterium]
MKMSIPDELVATFNGSLVSPGDDGYDEVRAVHNGLIDKRPGLIARCHNVADVRDAVTFGRDAGLEVSARGGGHNVAGRAVTEGGLMIDLSLMRGVDVDPARRRARAQGGATWNEYNRATAVYGQATTGGVISTTGVAGLTLGGGLGWLMGRHGMAVDNVTQVELVTADSHVHLVNAENDPDLFWALRGGGGNFGVAASIEFETHPLDVVLGGLLAHPLAAAAEVISMYRQFTKGVSDDVTLFCALVHAPDGSGTKLCGIPLCHAGDLAQAESELRPLREFGPPVEDLVQAMPYPVVNTLLDDGFPPGALNYWKSAFFTELSDAAIQTMIEAFENAPSIMSGLAIEHFHGAVCRVDPTATAYPHRDPGFNLLIAGEWLDPSETESNIAWVRETYAALAPYMAPRIYVNYMGDDDSDRIRDAYGPNYDRLLELKRRYDPDNLFRLNQNIDPGH